MDQATINSLLVLIATGGISSVGIDVLMAALQRYAQKQIKSDVGKYLFSVVVCMVAGTLASLAHLSKVDPVMGFFVVATSAEGIFNLYWKNSFKREQLTQKLVSPTV